MHTYNLSIWEVETLGLGVLCHPWLHREFKGIETLPKTARKGTKKTLLRGLSTSRSIRGPDVEITEKGEGVDTAQQLSPSLGLSPLNSTQSYQARVCSGCEHSVACWFAFLTCSRSRTEPVPMVLPQRRTFARTFLPPGSNSLFKTHDEIKIKTYRLPSQLLNRIVTVCF